MNTPIKLAIIGGDERQITMAKELTALGYSINIWGVGEIMDRLYAISAFKEWKDAIAGANAIVLPLPMTSDGIRIRSPLHQGDSLRWQTLLEYTTTDQMLLAGRPEEGVLRFAEERGISVVDYFLSESLQLKNAMVTSEGAISLAMKLLPTTIYGCNVAILGYGRIGKFLADRLHELGAFVTVYARREEVVAEAEMNHCNGRRLWKHGEDADSLKKEFSSYRVIFNTVPYRLLERGELLCIPKNCILMDLASVPGGFDHKAAEELGLEAVWATALPGKYAPERAGQILAETVDGLIREDKNGMQNQYRKD
jgi:dipicolinate synthase subunit A